MNAWGLFVSHRASLLDTVHITYHIRFLITRIIPFGTNSSIQIALGTLPHQSDQDQLRRELIATISINDNYTCLPTMD